MAYEIEFITDDRFNGTKQQLIKMDSDLKKSLKNLNGVELETIRSLYHITFENKKTNQWRITYKISKDTNKITWNDVFCKVNKIYAPYYKRVRG